MAYIEARLGRPTWLIKSLRDAGLDELAEGIETGEVKFSPLSEDDFELVEAATEFRRLGLDAYDENTVTEFAVKRGIGATEFSLFVKGKGWTYRHRLKKFLPQDLFRKIKRD